MTDKSLNLIDSLKDLKDESSLRGKYFGVGEIEIRNSLGEVILKKKNLIVLTGRVFTLEKIFNVNSSTEFTTLNEDYDHKAYPVTPDGPRKEEEICLFGVGKGGCDLLLGSVKSNYFREDRLKDMIPFRYILPGEEDLSSEEREKYFLRVENEGSISYYLKAFKAKPELKINRYGEEVALFDTEGEINEESGPVQDADVFVEIALQIEENDFQEYFAANDDLGVVRFNELALFFAYRGDVTLDNPIPDYEEIQMFSIISFNNEPLEDMSKALDIYYRVYA
jgi:hypothetical protein